MECQRPLRIYPNVSHLELGARTCPPERAGISETTGSFPQMAVTGPQSYSHEGYSAVSAELPVTLLSVETRGREGASLLPLVPALDSLPSASGCGCKGTANPHGIPCQYSC